MVTIVNYGLGNVGSIYNMLKHIGIAAAVTSDPKEIELADKIILPGVGHFDNAVKLLNKTGFKPIINKKALVDNVPILGICLGMQLLAEGSEEGTMSGFGWIKGTAKKFAFREDSELKIPHMGWNNIICKKESPLTRNFNDDFRFYFVHSYYLCPADEDLTILTASHGITFAAALQKNNIFGVQFHPEKSHRFGMAILANFAAL